MAYSTKLGRFFVGDAEKELQSSQLKRYIGKVNLIFTSPPFALNTKKSYGNREGEAYIDWIAEFAPRLREFLTPDGSIVMEIGNSWEPGRPVMSTLPLRALLKFLAKGDLNLCQQFIWQNPARLPSPAQWVNVERIRVKDTFTHIWWMSASDRPKANNRNVLKEYSASMNQLLKSQKYNAGKRPSEHKIGEKSFLTNNDGAIPSNVLSVSNTRANSAYLNHCRIHKLKVHPARMPVEIPEFFIKLLTDEGDTVLDPFAGSNTTGYASENLGRNWVSVEINQGFAEGSKGNFGLFVKQN